MARTLRRRGQDYDERMDVLDRVKRSTTQDRVKLCALALKNDARPVRLFAAEILGTVRELRVVPILIAALGKEKKVTVQNAIVGSLRKLTRRPFGKDTKQWKGWWRTYKREFKLPEPLEEPKPAVPRKKKKNTGERRSVALPRFYGITVDATDIVFVVDQSTSMLKASPKGGGNRWETAVREVNAVVAKLPANARVNVVLFATDVWTWRESITPLNDKSRRELEYQLARQRPGGGTYLFEGIERALQDREVEAIYLLSDGEPSGGKYKTDSAILREVGKLNRYRRAIIHVVAVGYDSSVLMKLASTSGGRYVKR